MASVKENTSNGKVTSYRFTVCMGRDKDGKQIMRTMTWRPPSDLSPAKARKAAERAADQWERIIRSEGQGNGCLHEMRT